MAFQPKNKIRVRWFPILIGLSIFFSGCRFGGGEKDTGSNEDDGVTAIEAVPVETTIVSRGSLSSFIVSSSTVRPSGSITVFAKVRGRVEKILAREGDEVEKDDILAVLEDEELRLQYERVKEQARQSELALERTRKLYAEQLVSDADMESAELKAELSEKDVELARIKWEATRIRASISGIIVERLIQPGQRVEPMAPTFMIENQDTLFIDLRLPERDLVKIKPGMNAIISPGYNEKLECNGVVKTLSRSIDPASGTGKVTVMVTENNGVLNSGSFVRVKILTETKNDALLIPKKALVRSGNTISVFVVENDTLAVRRVVKAGLEDADWIEALSGIVEGEKVITIGQQGLKDSTKVELM